MLLIQNGTIYTPDEVIDGGTVGIKNGRIVTIAAAQDIGPIGAAEVIDATGKLLVPGFIDLQCNGGFGHDFTADPASIWEAAARLPQYGVTTFLPTIITSPFDTIQAAQAVIANVPADFKGTWPLGLHLEGPFLNPAKKGAHNPHYLCSPQVDRVLEWSPESGVCLVTLAPELDGALEVVAKLAENGVVVSAGHSMATFDEAAAGFDAGMRYGTHLFNAMPQIHHREPGLAGALLADDRLVVGLIPDGIHVHPALIKTVWQTLGNGRLNLVTDAMGAIGMPSGTYLLGEFEVTVTGTTAHLANGTLAGSVIVMDEAIRKLIDYTDCSLAEALPTVTTTPARLLGLKHKKGQIAPGFDADLVLLNPDLTVDMTFVNGQIVYKS
ncbi:MAG: N-acetylglucosamine-6-phosphate deacetylase [Anaerolineales bacterium]|nr:N-acetylglucosamine-6-phosphate deacetylase [Anaerolineales bacterium]